MRRAKTRANKASCTVMRGFLGRVRAVQTRRGYPLNTKTIMVVLVILLS